MKTDRTIDVFKRMIKPWIIRIRNITMKPYFWLWREPRALYVTWSVLLVCNKF